MQLKPLFARVLLERPTFQSSGSIIIPDQAKQRYATLKCRVIDKGPEADESVGIGSMVLIGRHAGAWFSAAGDPVVDTESDEGVFYICQDEDIICEVIDD